MVALRIPVNKFETDKDTPYKISSLNVALLLLRGKLTRAKPDVNLFAKYEPTTIQYYKS